jgi:hypothetical protein
LGGRIIASRIPEIESLLPIFVVGSVLDLWSVFMGVTHEMIAKKSVALDYLLIQYPSFHSETVSQLVGLSDFLFISILMGVVIKFNFGIGKNILMLNLGLVTTFLLVVITSTGIPALPVISIFFVIGNYKNISMKKEDFYTTLIILVGSISMFYAVLLIKKVIS